MDLRLLPNTPDDVILGQVYSNARLGIPLVKSLPAHDRHAVLVGGGPSLKRYLQRLKARAKNGQTIFALNNSAKWLLENGIEPHYQVILDARAGNKSFIAPLKVAYLFASQVHPSLFEDVEGDVLLWHPQWREEQDVFDKSLPDDTPEHALIGGGLTVGLSAMALAYTLGYRKLHLFGYDSSFEDGESHAYKQHDPNPQNAPVEVTHTGQKFISSLAMVGQAESFQKLADDLIDLGCIITLDCDGLLPYLSAQSSKPKQKMEEEEKYKAMWAMPEYRRFSPGERIADIFLEIVRPTGTVLDLGCGTGKAALKISKKCAVVMVDFADNCIDDEAKCLPFVKADLSKEIPVKAEYGFCADVMEHIPPEQVDDVLKNILGSCNKVFFQISLVPDGYGVLIGETLHLSVHPYDWWLGKLNSLGKVIWSKDDGSSAMYYFNHLKETDARV